jgi:hypothetical protein
MQKPIDDVRSELEFSLDFVAGGQAEIDFNTFYEFHKNIYYVQPKENLTHFVSTITKLWGYKQ